MHKKIPSVYIDNFLLFSSYISYVNRNKKSGYQKTSVIPPQAEGISSGAYLLLCTVNGHYLGLEEETIGINSLR